MAAAIQGLCLFLHIGNLSCISQIVAIAESKTIVTALPIVGVGLQQLNGTIVHCTRYKGSSEIQDGGLQTKSILISQLV